METSPRRVDSALISHGSKAAKEIQKSTPSHTGRGKAPLRGVGPGSYGQGMHIRLKKADEEKKAGKRLREGPCTCENKGQGSLTLKS
jgi:hypothetical protein